MKSIIPAYFFVFLCTLVFSQNQIEVDSLKDPAQDAIHITHAVGTGIGVSAGGAGVQVNTSYYGMYIRNTSYGVSVFDAELDGFNVLVARGNGVSILNAFEDGVKVEYAGKNGVSILSAIEDGINVGLTGGNGISVQEADGFGIRAFGQAGNYFRGSKGANQADIILGALSEETSEDNGTISSDPFYPSSDIFLTSNDAIILRLDRNGGEEGNFEIRDSDGDQLLVMLEGGQFEVWDGDGKRKLLLETNGNLTIDGMLTELSDQQRKENIQPVDHNLILDKLQDIPVSTWNYRGDATPHLGPMAQDFYRAFQLGTDKGIAGLDLQGALLAALQAQQDIIEKQQSEIEQLQHAREVDRAKQKTINQSLQQQIEALKKLVIDP